VKKTKEDKTGTVKKVGFGGAVMKYLKISNRKYMQIKADL